MTAGFDEAEKLRARLKVTSEIAEAINRSLDLDYTLNTTLDRLLSLYGISFGIIVVKSRTGILRVGSYRGLALQDIDPVFAASERIIKQGKSVIIDEKAELPDWLSFESGESLYQSMVSVPIWTGEEPVGVLHLAADSESFFNTSEATFLEPLANVVGVAITNARLYKALTDELKSTQTVNEVAKQVTEGSLEANQLLIRVTASLRECFNLGFSSFLMLDPLRTNLILLDTGGSEAMAGLRIPLRSEPLFYRAFFERKALSASERNDIDRLANLFGINLEAVAIVPLITGGLVIGILILGRVGGSSFTSGELGRLETVAAYVAGALENSRLYQESLDLNRDLIELDSVTQLTPLPGELNNTVRQLLERAVLGSSAEGGIIYYGIDEDLYTFVYPEGFDGLMSDRMSTAGRSAAIEKRHLELRLPSPQLGSFLAIPMNTVSNTQGSLVIYKLGSVEERDRRLCSVIADRSGSILDNARLFNEIESHLAELTKRNQELVVLNQRNLELTSKLSTQLNAREREAQLAADIQKSLLVNEIPQGDDLDLAVAYLPLEEASGDYYDVFRIDEDKIGIVITDAVGHGVPAAFIGGLSKMLLDEYKPRLSRGQTPAEVLVSINNRLCSYGHNQLMTMFFGVYNKSSRKLTYANGGHPYPLLFRRGQVIPLESKSHIMGAWLTDFECRTVDLEVGDKVLFYTDGLVEAHEPSGRRLGKRAVIDWVIENHNLSASSLNYGLYKVLMEFTKGILDHDDVTLLTLSVLSGASIENSLDLVDMESLSEAWIQVRTALALFAYDSKDQFNIRLALEEAVTNAIRHGSKKGQPAVLKYHINGAQCQFEVCDSGPGFNAAEIPDPTAPDKLLVSGGRGIFLIRKSVDEATWNDKGNEVSLLKKKGRTVNILISERTEGANIVADELKVSISTEGGISTLSVVGAADAVSAPKLSEGLDELVSKGDPSILDLYGVTFLGSAAVSILVKAFNNANSKGIKLVLIKPKDTDVAEMLEILGLMSIFPVSQDSDGAVKLLG